MGIVAIIGVIAQGPGDMTNTLFEALCRALAGYLQKTSKRYHTFSISDPARLRASLQPADVLLVEGNQRISAAIKYLTQSTWSHAALYAGPALAEGEGELIEADLSNGVIAVPLGKYAGLNTRICRPLGLTAADRERVIAFAVERLGMAYDLRNAVDLARYLFPTPPVPFRWRRRLLAFGSGDPTRAICSTLIAQAFQSVRYPILPEIAVQHVYSPIDQAYSRREILHIRHHSLFVPRDFDLSPYFTVVKPTIEGGFDYKALTWAGDAGLSPGAKRVPNN